MSSNGARLIRGASLAIQLPHAADHADGGHSRQQTGCYDTQLAFDAIGRVMNPLQVRELDIVVIKMTMHRGSLYPAAVCCGLLH